MTEAQREGYRRRNREWAKRNPDKVREGRQRRVALVMATGLCVHCGIRPRREHRRLCATCAKTDSNYKRQRRYGISETEYYRLLKEQGGVCAICHNVQHTKLMAVDHNHDTNETRGLLCNTCNLGLGYLRDSVLFLESAIGYLKRHGA